MDKYSFLNTIHTDTLDSLYHQYLSSPDNIEASWRSFFQGFDFGIESSLTDETEIPKSIQGEFKVINLINDYRKRGHLFTNTNPVRERRKYTPTLNYTNHGLDVTDLQKEFKAGELVGIGTTTLQNIIEHLKKIYCTSIGIEYMYIRDDKQIEWIQKNLHLNNNQPQFSFDKKKQIFKKLSQAVTFEKFIHSKYVGQKRFSLEGGEALIPALDALIETAALMGVEQFVMGMAHRGRLNVLANIFGKSPKDIFSEFDGKDYEQSKFDGDVKYHLGWTSIRKTDSGKEVNMNLAPNPSHLEAVSAIVQGISRSKQDLYHADDFSKVLPIIVHGDAAIAGQGIVYEIVQMANLNGYTTNGTIHIVINNQIGFTTNYLDARSSVYCTDIAKITQSPVFHINADDTEAVVHATLFALKYRMEFKHDVFIDLLGYRKYGHNEGDEPRFTQPKLYKSIMQHPNPKEIYQNILIEQGILNQSSISKIESDYLSILEEKLEDSKEEEKTYVMPIMEHIWKNFKLLPHNTKFPEVDTSYSKEKLASLAKKITTLPKEKVFFKKIEKLFNERKSMFFEKKNLDWAMCELLAYASLLEEGFNIRISGQDVERGTFSHRHAVIKSEQSEEKTILLNTIPKNNNYFNIYNSLLSEYGILGFEYGYALANPNTLTIWEAQFGDFGNGAQIIFDQYISSAESKWRIQNGIVLLLPHGYEGQGAEHSSARIERYLQLCARQNIIIANCTTPANFFHLLRRQLKFPFRKPLIVFTPKSLLRHPHAKSNVNALNSGSFKKIIIDNNANIDQVKQLVFCSGKFYYDLIKEKEKLNKTDTVLIRLEQLYPLNETEIKQILNLYKTANDFVWAQEEPVNMGAWSYLLTRYSIFKSFRVVARRIYSSPASGSPIRDARRHQEVIDYVFDKTNNNI